jgi:hypothetical protein
MYIDTNIMFDRNRECLIWEKIFIDVKLGQKYINISIQICILERTILIHHYHHRYLRITIHSY